ncbi:hypothetical protein O9K51_03742 [Purpureocillium lavendulum]|uniref:Secreted protein n=1 Tax=Purpureocillium lavendulum TaxID=1247861 RepID=A0AB34FTY5_9HYPO|nr:hypothetical protein O9K51_03742 [Purpureocillium lavendulum]
MRPVDVFVLSLLVKEGAAAKAGAYRGLTNIHFGKDNASTPPNTKDLKTAKEEAQLRNLHRPGKCEPASNECVTHKWVVGDFNAATQSWTYVQQEDRARCDKLKAESEGKIVYDGISWQCPDKPNEQYCWTRDVNAVSAQVFC